MYIKVNDAMVRKNGITLLINKSIVPNGSIASMELTTVDELNEAVIPAARNSSNGPIRITLK